ncbi:MAG: hypothetical protein ABUL62_09040 [Myxococcales bacterium]
MSPSSSHAARFASFVTRYWAGALSLLVSSALVLCIALEEIRLRAGSFADFSDYWEHAAVLRALIDDPWRPSNPHLPNLVSSPRFGPVNVMMAFVARGLGLDALNALGVLAVVNTLCFVLGIWLFFRTYFRDSRAGLYGLLVMLGSWWEAWTFTSIYQPKVLLSVACYPWLSALGITLLGLALALRSLRKPKPRAAELALLVLWAALVFLTHQITAMLALSALGLAALTEPHVSLPRRAWVVGAGIAGCVLSGLWPYFSVWHLLRGGQQEAGWVSQGLEAAARGVVVVERHRFYRPKELLPALGLALLGVAFLPYFFLRWRRLFVGLGVLSMLGPFVLNAFIPLPLGHRFILLAVFFLHVAVVWLLMALTPDSAEFVPALNRRWLRVLSVVVVWAVLLPFVVHNVQRTMKEWAYFETFARRGASPFVRYGRRVAELAGDHAVILGETRVLWPIPAFGPKVVAAHHENPFIPDEAQREAAIDLFFARQTSDDTRVELLRRYHVSHVIVKREPLGSARAFLAAHAHRDVLPAGYLLFTLDAATSGARCTITRAK